MGEKLPLIPSINKLAILWGSFFSSATFGSFSSKRFRIYMKRRMCLMAWSVHMLWTLSTLRLSSTCDKIKNQGETHDHHHGLDFYICITFLNKRKWLELFCRYVNWCGWVEAILILNSSATRQNIQYISGSSQNNVLARYPIYFVVALESFYSRLSLWFWEILSQQPL